MCDGGTWRRSGPCENTRSLRVSEAHRPPVVWIRVDYNSQQQKTRLGSPSALVSTSDTASETWMLCQFSLLWTYLKRFISNTSCNCYSPVTQCFIFIFIIIIININLAPRSFVSPVFRSSLRLCVLLPVLRRVYSFVSCVIPPSCPFPAYPQSISALCLVLAPRCVLLLPCFPEIAVPSFQVCLCYSFLVVVL